MRVAAVDKGDDGCDTDDDTDVSTGKWNKSNEANQLVEAGAMLVHRYRAGKKTYAANGDAMYNASVSYFNWPPG